MQTKRSKHLRWPLTIVALFGGSLDLIGFRAGEFLGYAYADELISSGFDSRTSALHPEVAVSTSDRRAIDASDTQICLSEIAATSYSNFVPAGYELVWQDEFDGTDLNLRKWGYRSEGQSSDGSGCSTLSRESVSVDGEGHLVLTTKEVNGILMTGMVSTNDKFEPLYGYFEARIRFQRQQGHHGAFWLKPRSFGRFPGDPGLSGVEIDVAEFFGSGRHDGGVGINVYWLDEQRELEKRQAKVKLLDLNPILTSTSQQGGSKRRELCDDFHVFSLTWTAQRYAFFIDGYEMFSTADGISHQGQPIIFSLLSSKWETQKLDRDKLGGDKMLVDYVRVYQAPVKNLGDRGKKSTLNRK